MFTRLQTGAPCSAATLISRVAWGLLGSRPPGLPAAWTPSPLSPGGGGRVLESLSPPARPQPPSPAAPRSLTHCRPLCPVPQLEERKPAAGPRGQGAAPSAWPGPRTLTAGRVPAEQPVQRGGPGRGCAQHDLRRHAAVLHVPAARPHREARLQVDPRACHVLLCGLLPGQLLRQLVRPLPAAARTLPHARAGRDRVPRFPAKTPLSPLLGHAPLTPHPAWPLLGPPASLLGQGGHFHSPSNDGEKLPKMWRVNFRGSGQSVAWARPHTLTPSQRGHAVGLEPVSRAAPELRLLRDRQGPSGDPCSQGHAAQASPRGTPLVIQDALMCC